MVELDAGDVEEGGPGVEEQVDLLRVGVHLEDAPGAGEEHPLRLDGAHGEHEGVPELPAHAEVVPGRGDRQTVHRELDGGVDGEGPAQGEGPEAHGAV